MKLLWLCVILPAVVTAGFGKSVLKNSRLCHRWNCINTRLGLPDELPPRQQSDAAIRRILPEGPWQGVVDKVLDNCYENRSRQYTNTCPGQALMHCVVDQMIDNCPEESKIKSDSCSPVSSLAGIKTMFSLSRYYNLEENLPKEKRPEWFLKNYFDQQCCDIPVMFNTSVLQDCGFSSFITYYAHGRNTDDMASTTIPVPTTTTDAGDKLKIADFNQEVTSTSSPQEDFIDLSTTDPLDCCDMSGFIQPTWRSDCSFQLSWKGQERLVIANETFPTTTEVPTTTTVSADAPKDLMMLPQSCEAEACVFKKLDIITESGEINKIAFMQLLDNLTEARPVWKKAASRVVTKCLNRNIRDYEGCEINKVLGCALDVLTENCPYHRKSEDSCKHNKRKSGCQISSSKYRLKSRREVCLLPPLVHNDLLSECGLNSLYRVEHVLVSEHKFKKHTWPSSYMCQEQTPSTTCLLDKMGILNKYKFMDYFRMKEKIRMFTQKQTEWSALQEIYLSAFINIPMYGQHCSSQKKLLNVVDTMLMTCPISKRVSTPQCTKLFKEITNTTPLNNQNFTRKKLEGVLDHYQHIFLPNQQTTTKFDKVIRRPLKTEKKPIYNYGVLDSKHTPKVKLISIKPAVITSLNKPLVLAPVYLRDPTLQMARPLNNDPAFRSDPYWLHDRIAKAHVTAEKFDPNVMTSTFIPEDVAMIGKVDNRFTTPYITAQTAEKFEPYVMTSTYKPSNFPVNTYTEAYDSRFTMIKPE